ncbi:MAG: hypothetical protein ACD_4C00087G0005, partial [uncultured bacterium (gcode 4)]
MAPEVKEWIDWNKKIEDLKKSNLIDEKKFSKTQLDNIKDLDLKALNKDEKYSEKNINDAIETRFNLEINKLWVWINSKELEGKKGELLNNLNSINNIEDKLKAYSEFIDWIKSDVWTWVAEQKKQNKDFRENQEKNEKNGKEKNEDYFKKTWKEIKDITEKLNREKITKEIELSLEAKANISRESWES